MDWMSVFCGTLIVGDEFNVIELGNHDCRQGMRQSLAGSMQQAHRMRLPYLEHG